MPRILSLLTDTVLVHMRSPKIAHWSKRSVPRPVKNSLRIFYRFVYRTPQLSFTTTPRLERWNHKLPLVSIVIPCRNYGRYIGDAIRSIRSQTFKGCEIIVVDGSTEPSTLQVLKDLKQTGVIVLSQAPRGVSAARNAGILFSKGKYVCCLDADDTLEPTYLEKCLALLESNPGISLAYSLLKTFGDEHPLILGEHFNLRLLLEYNHVPTCAVFRGDILDAVKGFDEAMRAYEDWDFWIRVGSAGFRGRLIPEVLVNRRLHPGSLQDSADNKDRRVLIKQISEKNRELFSNPDQTVSIQRRYHNLQVPDPFLNMSLPSLYQPVKKSACLVIASGDQLRKTDPFLKILLQLKTENGFDFAVILTRTSLKSVFWEFSTQVYDLTRFLDSYCWLDFVVNVIASRRIKLVILYNSKLGYLWASEIKNRTSALLIDVLADSSREYAELGARFEGLLSRRVSLSTQSAASFGDAFGLSEEKLRAINVTAPAANCAKIFAKILREVIPERQ